MLSTDNMNAKAVQPTRRVGLLTWITKRYTKQGLWSLFLMCVFPLHVWTLILAFRDFSWVSERTDAWDAVGVVAYGLLFTLVETLLIFGILVLLGYLVLTYWDVDHRVALLSCLVWIAAIWAMLDQLFFLAGASLPHWFIAFLVSSGHPLRVFYVVLIGLIGITVAVPAWFVLRPGRGYAIMRGLMERLSTLAVFYLVLDLIAVVIVIVRNV